MERVKAILLAAGKGSRLASEHAEVPKAMRLVNGRPLIDYVLDGIDFVRPEDLTVVVGFLGQQVVDHLQGRCQFVWQTEQKGTAHATLCARDAVKGFSGPVMALYCDMPLLSGATYRRMVEEHVHAHSHNTLLVSRIHPIPPFGRILLDGKCQLMDVVEQSACTEEQKKIDLVNVGVQVLRGDTMMDKLELVDNNNPKREHYLTGVTRIMYDAGLPQHVVHMDDSHEFWGVNTMEDLQRVEDYLAARK